jgi:hypothetical protein
LDSRARFAKGDRRLGGPHHPVCRGERHLRTPSSCRRSVGFGGDSHRLLAGPAQLPLRCSVPIRRSVRNSRRRRHPHRPFPAAGSNATLVADRSGMTNAGG